MNRAFLIIMTPACLVAAAYLAVGWGYTVPVPAALVALAVAFAAVTIHRLRKHSRDEQVNDNR